MVSVLSEKPPISPRAPVGAMSPRSTRSRTSSFTDDSADGDELAAVLSACQSEVSSLLATSVEDSAYDAVDGYTLNGAESTLDEEEILSISHSVQTTVANNNAPEVLYQDGATILFCALEECEWKDALDVLDHLDSAAAEKQLRTWVKTKQQENEAEFAWNLWKRLPIHEAARRQAPAWLVAKMLTLYPESAAQTTQFGELPLHLAVETGCVLEVINLLLVSYFPGIHHRDNSGRTPLDIARDSDDGDALVTECLHRSYIAHESMTRQFETAIMQLKRDHKLALKHVTTAHELEMRAERERQNALEESVGKIQSHVTSSERAHQKMKLQVQNHKKEKSEYVEEIQGLHEQIVILREDVSTDQQANKDLLEELAESIDKVRRLELVVKTLSEDLTHTTLSQAQTIASHVVQAEKDMKTFLISQETLKAQLVSQAKHMTTLLKDRGIDLPVRPKNSIDTQAPNTDLHRVADAAAQSAWDALQQVNDNDL